MTGRVWRERISGHPIAISFRSLSPVSASLFLHILHHISTMSTISELTKTLARYVLGDNRTPEVKTVDAATQTDVEVTSGGDTLAPASDASTRDSDEGDSKVLAYESYLSLVADSYAK